MTKRKVAGLLGALVLGVVLLQGCSYLSGVPVLKELPFVPKPEEELQPTEKRLGVKMIAILPVDIKSGSRDAARMLRDKLLDELYFNGYSKVPFEMVDAALAEMRRREGGASGSTVQPQVIGSMLGVDAVMYTTLVEANTTYRYVYAPVTIAAVFELRSVQTGGTLWRFESRVADRTYGVTKNSIDLETTKILEGMVSEVVKKAVADLPDGPAITGAR